MMKRPQQVIMWTMTNGLWAWAAWAGFQGNAGAGRVAIFLAWVCLIGCSIISGDNQLKAKARKKGSSVPCIASALFSYGLAGLFAWHGWWVTAVVVLIGEELHQDIYDYDKDEETE